MVNGKAKGSSKEREVCKKLSLWLSNGGKEDYFWRSAMSGGRATVAKQKGTPLGAHAGDISATSEIGHKLTNKFIIEVKHYKNLNLEYLFFEKSKGNVKIFWERLVADAEFYNKLPMLIAQQNRHPTLIILDFNGWDFFGQPSLYSTQIFGDKGDLCICEFDTFLQNVKPEILF